MYVRSLRGGEYGIWEKVYSELRKENFESLLVVVHEGLHVQLVEELICMHEEASSTQPKSQSMGI